MARDRTFWALLESVSLCTRFPGFSTISSFSLVIVITVNKLKIGKYVLWDIIVPMFLDKDFVRDCFVAQIHANSKTCVRAGIRAYLLDEATPSKITNIGSISRNMPTNF